MGPSHAFTFGMKVLCTMDRAGVFCNECLQCVHGLFLGHVDSSNQGDSNELICWKETLSSALLEMRSFNGDHGWPPSNRENWHRPPLPSNLHHSTPQCNGGTPDSWWHPQMYPPPPLRNRPPFGGNFQPSLQRQPTKSPSLFQCAVDRRCHPTNGSFCRTKNEAHELLMQNHGGFKNGQSCTMSDGKEALAKGVQSHKCHCRAHPITCWESQSLGDVCKTHHCNFRAQIRHYPSGEWVVMTHPKLKTHNHDLQVQPEDHRELHELHPTIRRLAQEHVGKRSYLRIKPLKLMLEVTKRIHNDPDLDHVLCLVTKDRFFQHTKRQLTNWTTNNELAAVRDILGE